MENKLKIGDFVIITKQHSNNPGLGLKGILKDIDKVSHIPYYVFIDSLNRGVWHEGVELANKEIDIVLW
jgi:hypothetical protein